MSSTKRIIAVVGATGNQGGGLVRDLLKDGEFAVRAVTRNPDGAAGKELSRLGVEVVKADLENFLSLTEAFKGVYGVFGITVWALYFGYNLDQAKTEAHETQWGKNLADAAKLASVKHFVWSTLDDIESIHIYHFKSKQAVNKHMEEIGLPFTSLHTSFYYQNLFLPGITFLKKVEGHFVLDIPVPSDTKLHWFDGTDVGRWVIPILKDPKFIGKRVDAVAEYLTARETAALITRVTGKEVRLLEVTPERFYSDEYHNTGDDEIWLNMKAWHEGLITRDIAQSNEVGPNPVTFEQFLHTNAEVRALLELSDPSST